MRDTSVVVCTATSATTTARGRTSRSRRCARGTRRRAARARQHRCAAPSRRTPPPLRPPRSVVADDELSPFGDEIGAQSALDAVAAGRAVDALSCATPWHAPPDGHLAYPMIGITDRAFRGFNRRERVLANDHEQREVEADSWGMTVEEYDLAEWFRDRRS